MKVSNIKIKVKNFLKLTPAHAIEHFGLSKDEYEQIISFINGNTLAGKQMIYVYPRSDGRLDVRLTAKDGERTSSPPNILAEPTTSDANKPKLSNKQEVNRGCGNYIVTSMQPGMAPYIQSGSTSTVLANVMAGLSILCGGAYLTWQICNIVFGIQDRRAAKAHPIMPTSASGGVTPTTNSDTNTL